MKINRRDWLRSTSVATAAGMFIGPLVKPAFVNEATETDTGTIILNANENALGPSEAVLRAVETSVKTSNRYPWQTRQMLADRISALEGVPTDRILIGAGSTEILQLAGLAFGAHGGTIVSSYPTFPMMMQHAINFDARWIKVPLDNRFGHDLDALLEAAAGAQLVYISNPNNPVGSMTPVQELLRFCRSVSPDTVVFVDEAYIEFCNAGLKDSVAGEVAEAGNLIVARTFSKIYGMAGLRVGYAYAHPDLIRRMKRYHIGFEINIPLTSLYAATAAAGDQDFIRHCKAENRRNRQLVYDAFDKWGVTYVPSETNFIYFETRRFAPDITRLLEKNGILILSYPDQPGYARVSIGTEAQMQHFLEGIRQYLT